MVFPTPANPSGPNNDSQRNNGSRREFLIRSAAACAASSSLVAWTSSDLLAMHPVLAARETAQGFLASLSNDQRALAQIEFKDQKRS